MDKSFLYQQIAEEIRRDILEGRLQSGDRLPSMREMTRQWKCTPGTVQRAYQELARQGLVTSRAGKGTLISGQLDLHTLQAQAPLRQAAMVHRSEAFLLEALTTGYSLEEIQRSFSLALDRWRAIQGEAPFPADRQTIRFHGSHDMAVVWLASHMESIAPGVNLQLTFTGSLGGLMALAEGRASLAGCHLLDAESGVYNEPFLQKLFPGKQMALIHLAVRKLGLIIAPGNPLNFTGLEDLARPGVRFVNRQSGSGTRVWLDSALQTKGVDRRRVPGYNLEKATHSAVAQEIAENRADLGVGLQSAAAAFGLGFVPLLDERYDLVAYAEAAGQPPLAPLLEWLASEEAKRSLAAIQGYDFSQMGEVKVING